MWINGDVSPSVQGKMTPKLLSRCACCLTVDNGIKATSCHT